MCRVAGIAGFGIDPSEREAQVRLMCDQLAHGGPDDQGLFRDDKAELVLGNRRLSLMDLSHEGHMPMSYEGRYHITYNGEIYNFPDLRTELELLGYRFRSHSDTEVILAAFAQWNIMAFSRLKGMFAFALWDAQLQELFLVRDPSGIKPLYYQKNETGIKFASELRVFDRSDHDAQAWKVYLMAYGHIPEPITTNSSVRPLPKGSFLKYAAISKKCSLQSFSHYSYSEPNGDSAVQAKQQIAAILEESVKRHLVADAPLGVFLSGGLDSGIIALLAAKHQRENLNTLSIYFSEAFYSEKKYQDILQKKMNCHHHQFLLEEKEFQSCFPTILNSMDMPSCDGINTWFISRHARKNGMKAVLSGLGGDELFGGYPSFTRVSKARIIQQYGKAWVDLNRKSNNKILKRLPYLRIEGIKGIYLFLRGLFNPMDIARHLDMTEKEVWDVLSDFPVYQNIKRLEHHNQASWMEFNLYMQNQLLRDSDVMSMIHGVEIRLPFLYEDVIRYADNLDPAVKFAGRLPKQILVDSFSDILPREIYDRPKMGFAFPFQEWLKGSAFVKELMSHSGKVLHNSYKEFLSGRMHWSQFMTLILLKNKAAIN
jgi:asparagine synthase (glutamine-hydrolysing)